MESNKLKEIYIKNCTFYCFDDIVKIKDFDVDNILVDRKSNKTFWFMTFHTKHCLVQNHCVLEWIY